MELESRYLKTAIQVKAREKEPAHRRWRWPRQAVGYLLIAPAVIYLIMIIAYPLFNTIRMSVTEISYPEKKTEFVGLQHYNRLLSLKPVTLPPLTDEKTGAVQLDEEGNVVFPRSRSVLRTDEYEGFSEWFTIDAFGKRHVMAAKDPIFWRSLKNTIVFTIASTILHALVGGFFALILNEKWVSKRIRNVARGLLILPWLFSMAASALMWALLYHPLGPPNYLLQASGLVSRPINFLGDRDLAIWSLVAVNVWKYFPFYMVMILGGLQSIPLDLYDAARVDGASRFQRFRFVTLPLLRDVLVATSAIDLITTFGVFDVVMLLTQGGPFRSTQTLAFYTWRVGFTDINIGYGSAISVLMLLMVGTGALLYLRLVTRKEAIYGQTTTRI